MCAYQKPNRDCGVKIMLDANTINARQKDVAINQLEQWRVDGVISLLMSEVANQEADLGKNAERSNKVASYVCTNSALISQEQKQRYTAIERAIFLAGATSDSEKNDVKIVYQAADWGYILVTNDGGSSRQPRGILGSSNELATLGVIVMRPEQAVEMVQEKLCARDRRVALKCEAIGMPKPDWVGKDCSSYPL